MNILGVYIKINKHIFLSLSLLDFKFKANYFYIRVEKSYCDILLGKVKIQKNKYQRCLHLRPIFV